MALPATTEANKANERRFVDEAFNRGILDFVDETRGEFAEQTKARIRAFRSAFPDLYTTIETLVAEDDWVAFHFRHQGTHEGEFLGIAATGKRVDFRTMGFTRFSNGVVVENWGLHDYARILEQLRSEQ
jgi:predicted ester cyclase